MATPVPLPAVPRERALAREPSRLKRALKVLGPGFITGASDADPTSIATYAKAGAALGYRTLWLALVLFPLLAAVQFMCAKVGMASGRGLAGVMRERYPRPVVALAVVALVAANTINAGADIGAIAAAINMFAPVPIGALIVPVGAALLALQLWASYRAIAWTFKWLAVALFAYVGAGVLAHPDARAVLASTFIPSIGFDRERLSMIVAIFGTAISPYLFFWQASEEVEEQKSMGARRVWQRRGTTSRELRYAAWDVNAGIFFTTLVMYFVILATAATLFRAGQHDVQTATDVARALVPLAGHAAWALLAVGLIGSGALAVPILTGSTAYAVAEAMRWPSGLDRAPREARAFYTIIGSSTLVGVAMNFVGLDPIAALFWSSVINGFVAPPLLVAIMLICNDARVMAGRPNGLALNVLGWATVAMMSLAAIGMLIA